jgi:hypothetical protein
VDRAREAAKTTRKTKTNRLRMRKMMQKWRRKLPVKDRQKKPCSLQGVQAGKTRTMTLFLEKRKRVRAARKGSKPSKKTPVANAKVGRRAKRISRLLQWITAHQMKRKRKRKKRKGTKVMKKVHVMQITWLLRNKSSSLIPCESSTVQVSCMHT